MTSKLTVGSLFSGIGGLELGLEWTGGFKVAWQSEIDALCCRFLAWTYPGVPNHGDIKAIDWASVEPVDVLAGGFPCQDVSVAGKQAGLKEGNRSGLWFEFARAIRALRPSYIIVENVPGLVRNGLATVLGDLDGLGYDTERALISAAAVGAPQKRERLFIIGVENSNRRGQRQQRICQEQQGRTQTERASEATERGDHGLADPSGERRQQESGGAHGNEAQDEGRCSQLHHEPQGAGPSMADPQRDGQPAAAQPGSPRAADAPGQAGWSAEEVNDGKPAGRRCVLGDTTSKWLRTHHHPRQ